MSTEERIVEVVVLNWRDQPGSRGFDKIKTVTFRVSDEQRPIDLILGELKKRAQYAFLVTYRDPGFLPQSYVYGLGPTSGREEFRGHHHLLLYSKKSYSDAERAGHNKQHIQTSEWDTVFSGQVWARPGDLVADFYKLR